VYGYGVKREIYGTYLMERTQNAGGKIRFRERLLNINRDHGCINIETDKSCYRSRFVFFALGWRGLSFFKKIGLQKYAYMKTGVAVQKILGGEHFQEPDTLCFYYLPKLIGRYFWVFP
jgi:flavin-dependent dehydrogenase